MPSGDFINTWKNIAESKEINSVVEVGNAQIDSVISYFGLANVFMIARRPVPGASGQEVVYFSCKTVTNWTFLAELTFTQYVSSVKLCVKTEATPYSHCAKDALTRLLQQV